MGPGASYFISFYFGSPSVECKEQYFCISDITVISFRIDSWSHLYKRTGQYFWIIGFVAQNFLAPKPVLRQIRRLKFYLSLHHHFENEILFPSVIKQGLISCPFFSLQSPAMCTAISERKSIIFPRNTSGLSLFLTFKSLGRAGDWAKLYVCDDVHTHHEIRIPAAKCTPQKKDICVSL